MASTGINMKAQEILMDAYTAYLLDAESRVLLTQQFPPKYPKFIGHHVTVQFGVPTNAIPPIPATLQVVGYVDDGKGLEALVVSVNGNTRREDGGTYHITWSLDPRKYSPKHSNDIIKTHPINEVQPIVIKTVPTVI
jgi:hypothetical protein